MKFKSRALIFYNLSFFLAKMNTQRLIFHNKFLREIHLTAKTYAALI